MEVRFEHDDMRSGAHGFTLEMDVVPNVGDIIICTGSYGEGGEETPMLDFTSTDNTNDSGDPEYIVVSRVFYEEEFAYCCLKLHEEVLKNSHSINLVTPKNTFGGT